MGIHKVDFFLAYKEKEKERLYCLRENKKCF